MGGWKNLTTACCIAAATLTACAPPEYPKPDPENEVVDAISMKQFSRAQQRLGDKKLALALIGDKSGTDPAMAGVEEHFGNSFAFIPDQTLFTYRGDTLGSKLNAWRDYALLKPISTLIIAEHGAPKRVGQMPMRHVRPILEGYSSTLAPDAMVILYSCDTGALGERGISQRFADVLDRDTVAPKFPIWTQSDLHPLRGTREFAMTESGQVTYNFGIYRLLSEGPAGPWHVFPFTKMADEPEFRPIDADVDTMFFQVDK